MSLVLWERLPASILHLINFWRHLESLWDLIWTSKTRLDHDWNRRSKNYQSDPLQGGVQGALIIFWPPILMTVRTPFGGPNEFPKVSQMTSKVDQMKDWSRKPFSEDKKYHSFISSDFQRDLPPLQNHAKTDSFSKIFLDALHLLVVRFAYQIKSKNSSEWCPNHRKMTRKAASKPLWYQLVFTSFHEHDFWLVLGSKIDPNKVPHSAEIPSCAWLSIKYGF